MPTPACPPIWRDMLKRSLWKEVSQKNPHIYKAARNCAMEFDLFISHASEDKDLLVRPLAQRLRNEGYSIWYDEFELKLGDSISEKIDYGLAKSRFGLVVLSPAFFKKNWTKRELRGLVVRDVEEKTILPIWHNVTKNDVIKFSPPLADAIAATTADGLEEIVKRIREVLIPIDFKSLQNESPPKCPEGMDDISSDLVSLCERAVSDEEIRLISWELDKEQQFFVLFRERRRGRYFQIICSQNDTKNFFTPTPKLCPKFLPLLEPDGSLWLRLTRLASIEDWCAIDEIIHLGLEFPDSEIRLLGEYSIGEDVADEALKRYGLYIPDTNLLPALMFENRKLGVILVVYLKHPAGFAKESILCDDNTNDCQVFSSLTQAQHSLSLKLHSSS